MKKNCCFILFLLLFAGANAGNIARKPGRMIYSIGRDSITDSWSLTYNGREILAYKINNVSTYLIDSITDNSFITIDYYTEVPCTKCLSRLQLKDENGVILATIQKNGFGEGEPFRLPGKQFRQLMRNHKMFLFFSANPDGWGTWVFLGVVKTVK